jgi:hypothetical protein
MDENNQPGAATGAEAVFTIRDASEISFDLPLGLSFAEWWERGRPLRRGHQGLQWRLGDWWRYGDHNYGDRVKALRKSGDSDFQFYADCGYVAGKFEISRRHEILSFQHHREVAGLDPADADRLLEWAENGGRLIRSTRELRKEVRLRTATTTRGARTKTPGKKPRGGRKSQPTSAVAKSSGSSVFQEQPFELDPDEIETDEIETDEIEIDEIDPDEIETDEIETDEIETDDVDLREDLNDVFDIYADEIANISLAERLEIVMLVMEKLGIRLDDLVAVG